MKKIIALAILFSAAFLLACSVSDSHQASAPAPAAIPQDPLFATISALDSEVFDSFNNCSVPQQLEKFSHYFSADVEFYHDTGGVTWTRDTMIANTQKNVCGKFQRELVPGSLKVFPIKDFGAMAQGQHRFCQSGASRCEGIADFILLWRNRGGQWEVTRVLSYGHRAND